MFWPSILRACNLFALSALLSQVTGLDNLHGTRYSDKNCCSLLSSQLPGKVLVSGIDNITAATEPYYAGQAQDMTPRCVVLPTCASDVSKAIRILNEGFENSLDYCSFAIRSGGHTPQQGANNIDGGVTINMAGLNAVIPNQDNSQVRVGPGNRWGDVYSLLDTMNLTVAGGRSRTVGVGGLVLSGGLSFFSPRFGMACDTILNYEIVLANGEIVNANQSSHVDLYKALKGGSNNFGVVTNFDMRAIHQEGLWGGVVNYNRSDLPGLLEGFSAFCNSDSMDPFAQLTLSYGLINNERIVSAFQHYTKPQPPSPTVFGSLKAQPISSTLRVDSLTNFTIELQVQEDGGKTRRAFATATYKNNLEMLQLFHELADATMDRLSSVLGLLFNVSMQSFGQLMTSKSAATGGNFLGLEADDGDRVLFCLTVTWTKAADDDVVEAAIRDLVERANMEAHKLNATDDYIYQNYAASWQDVYGSVGEKNIKELTEISKQYDPSQLFQKAVPGGFKLA